MPAAITFLIPESGCYVVLLCIWRVSITKLDSNGFVAFNAEAHADHTMNEGLRLELEDAIIIILTGALLYIESFDAPAPLDKELCRSIAMACS